MGLIPGMSNQMAAMVALIALVMIAIVNRNVAGIGGFVNGS